VDLTNLQTGLGWAADRGDRGSSNLENPTAIVAHSALTAFALQHYEPAARAEEILTSAATADIRRLPRL
jgi:hypothetical protein